MKNAQQTDEDIVLAEFDNTADEKLSFNAMVRRQRNIRNVGHGLLPRSAGWSIQIQQTVPASKGVEAPAADARKPRRSKLKNHLAFAAFGYGIVGAGNIVSPKLFLGQQRLQFVLLREFCCPMKNVSVIGTPDSRQQRQ